MATGYVVFDLSAMHGNATYVPPLALPRNDKKSLEVGLAEILLQSLATAEGIEVTGIRHNPKDPPDVWFDLNGQTIGLEITELLPENRLERDAIIRQVRKRVLGKLKTGDNTRDWVVTVMLPEDYASKLRLRCEDNLADTLNFFFAETGSKAPRSVANLILPLELQPLIRQVRVEPWDLTDDPRIQRRDEPLLIFTAQHTFVVPDRDFPKLLEERVGRKRRYDLAGDTWLLLWSNHYAFGPLKDDLVRHISACVDQHCIPHQRIFYLHLHKFGDITEFKRDQPS